MDVYILDETGYDVRSGAASAYWTLIDTFVRASVPRASR